MTFGEILLLPVVPVFAYLLGSVPFGLVLTRTFTPIDIRKAGSGNIGATNVRRTAGNALGILTLVCDVLKGMIPVLAALHLVPHPTGAGQFYLALVGLAAFAGHLWPIFLRFRDGGKGVATALGVYLALSPLAVLIALMVFAMAVCFTGRVSVGSLLASAALPVAVWESTGSGILTAAAVLTAVLILLRHKANIHRLMAGDEPRLF